ncbi:MAG: hypothetical protein P8188_06765 [Gemmatimonadota bacterium]|jgi:hypothetical protein
MPILLPDREAEGEGVPFGPGVSMKVYQRCAQGAEAGVIAGAGVALAFLLLDVVHLTPLATPSALASGLFHPVGYEYDTGLVARAASWVGTGFHMLSYTVLHFATFAALGVVAAFLLARTRWLGSLLGGIAFGVTGFTGVFFLSREFLDTPVVMAAITLPTLLLANGMAGAILGAGVYLARMPDAEDDGVEAV